MNFLKRQYVTLKPSRYGWFCGLTQDVFQTGAIITMGEWAPEETEMVCSLINPGDVVLDVGANVGNMTLAFAAATGQTGAVFAFEPQKYAYLCLCANVALNSLCHFVEPMRIALGEQHGEVECPILDPTKPMSNFGGVSLLDPTQHTERTELVPMVTIDSFQLPRVNVIKADVEGMEGAVLRGARETIKRCQPAIWAEQLEHMPTSRQELLDVFKEQNYQAWRIISHIYSPTNIRRERDTIFKVADGTLMEDVNVLALPASTPIPAWLGRAHSEPFK